jgi:O-acetyl-ADP-ribose deacetylase (regulator of RNase III)
VAVRRGVKSIAFPSISTGAYGYPIREASRVALEAVLGFLKSKAVRPELVRFVLFTQGDYEAYVDALRELTSGPPGACSGRSGAHGDTVRMRPPGRGP